MRNKILYYQSLPSVTCIMNWVCFDDPRKLKPPSLILTTLPFLPNADFDKIPFRNKSVPSGVSLLIDPL